MEKKSQQPNEATDLSFEKAIAELTDIVDKVEQGEIPLEESLRQYEKGMTLIKHCRTVLQQAERRIEKMSLQDDEPAEGSE